MANPAAEPTTSPADQDRVDLVIIGGGVMGLFTAWNAAREGRSVVVLEAGTVGDPATASFGRTRSYRRDYLDPLYVGLAERAIDLWADFEAATGTRALVRCGCMNIASAQVTPDLPATYGHRTQQVMTELGIAAEELDTAQLSERFPYLRADEGFLDPAGGLADLASVTTALLSDLRAAGVPVLEHTVPTKIIPGPDGVQVVGTDTSAAAEQVWHTGSVVITAGHGSNDVLDLLPDNRLRVPITKDRPSEAFYYTPAPAERAQYTAERMPVIAYLDTGIYLHPIVDGVIDAVKIGYYNPPDLDTAETSINSVGDFVEQVMPGLAGAERTPVTVVDQCDYDLVADDDFVLGPVPGQPGVWIGVGWRGTGYKFSPWVGRTLARLAAGDRAEDDLTRFDPARFR
ncbi:NAD(P)/FAD-dependent oxidoreductase [Naumannella halotolerans]|uniref:Glycine/D-amino acid oxidase-like deaminating enzyme n=1 Tax=Naumannella halotolerans TaxID=993414 RepID=A0A4R7J236_9ACTN|nr:FAD-dependent oxidoreductase [Naumannella halotolerans]TDT31200.1 glycine/D-amino acid oxidase-like deaminating enzyme [Naumannella halotolerans]